MEVFYDTFNAHYCLYLCGKSKHKVDLGTDPLGNLTRIENELAKIPVKLEAEKTKALKEYEEAQEAYATYADSNRNLNTLNARKELANLNLRRRIAYQGYTQKATQVSKAKENLVRQHPVLTIIQPSEVPLHPVSQWSAFLWCPLIAIACTTGWLYLKKRSFKLRIKKLKRPAIRRPLLFQRRFSL